MTEATSTNVNPQAPARRRGRPSMADKARQAGAQTTASGGNSRHPTKRLTLSERVGAMEKDRTRLIRLLDQAKQIVRGG